MAGLMDFAKRVARWCGYRVARVSNTQFFVFESLLNKRLEQVATFEFVQVGACDGRSFDPIHEFLKRHRNRVKGVVLEPLPDLFAELERSYRDFPAVLPRRLAVHNTQREMSLYRVNPARLSSLPEFARGIASFDPEHYRRSGIPADAIVPEQVPCSPLTEIIGEAGFSKLDLLQIDTEGYDAEILLHMDWHHVKPWIIRFEHGVSSGTLSPDRLNQVIDVLHEHGYELCYEDSDAIAWRRDIMLPVLSTTDHSGS